MNEKIEKVTTRIYSQSELVALLGEGKKDVSICVGFRSGDGGPTHWLPFSMTDGEVLKVKIREKFEEKK